MVELYGSGVKALPTRALAAYCNVSFVEVPFTPGITENTPAFRAKSSSGKYPIVQTTDGVIVDNVDVYRYINDNGDRKLYPAGDDRASAESWLHWTDLLADSVYSFLFPSCSSCAVFDHIEQAKAKLMTMLDRVNTWLISKSFAVGDAISVVDVVLASHMAPVYTSIMGPDVRGKYPALTAYLKKMYTEAVFQQLCGAIEAAPADFDQTKPWNGGPAPFQALCSKLEQPWSVNRTRAAFIEFYEAKKNHVFWPSSSVVPHNDPTLLFTNAGMNQYKPIFLGVADPTSGLGKLTRAANSQKCIRAGGKHNDLDDVGKDNYHHTFFEMLGNWSFGQYFKNEAIAWAWELLTDVYKLDSSRLYATYFEGDESEGLPPDEEARAIWRRFLPDNRIIPGNKKDNFWEMGDQGPCGPCTEIHYDRIGGRHVPELVNADDPNVLEIWNVVFIQFNREADGSLKLLPAQHVDTGMGLERITSVLQNQMSNYATDTFAPLFDAIQAATGCAKPYGDKVGADDVDGKDMAYRVVADHIRTLSFAIADGARPGSDGRDYVLRRILRRAVRYGREVLGGQQGFFAQLVDPLVAHMGGFYPELVSARDAILDVIKSEEASFSRTLEKGIVVFKKAAAAASDGVLDGATAFELWDTFGFPVDLTQLMAEEANLSVDIEGYEKAMHDAKERSRAAQKKGGADGLKFEAHATAWLKDAGVAVTDDEPKYTWENTTATVKAIMAASGFVQSTAEASGEPVGVVLDRTSFYAEQGGQVADTGTLVAAGGTSLDVGDCVVAASYVLHKGSVRGELKVGDEVTCKVDYTRRRSIAPNHTMTHVLNFALRKVLGEQVDQKGSIVLPDKLRFDFPNKGPVTMEQLAEIEGICAGVVASKLPVFKKVVPLSQAEKINGLRAVFGEAYPDPVKVVSVGKPVEDLLADPDNESNGTGSIEFCGGTHLDNTEEAGRFAILSEEGIAQGIRRITAVTLNEAEEALKLGAALEAEMAALEALADPQETVANALKVTLDTAVIPAVQKAKLRARVDTVIRTIIANKKARAVALQAAAKADAIAAADKAAAAGAAFLALTLNLPAANAGKAFPEAFNAVAAVHPSLPCLFLGPDADAGKCMVFAGVPKAVSGKLPAKEWCGKVLSVLGGKGGGKPETAQGSGPDVAKASDALAAGVEFAKLALA